MDFVQIAAGAFVGGVLATVVALIVWRRKSRPFPEAPQVSVQVFVPKEKEVAYLDAGNSVQRAFDGYDVREAKKIRRNWRSKGYKAVMFVEGEYRG